MNRSFGASLVIGLIVAAGCREGANRPSSNAVHTMAQQSLDACRGLLAPQVGDSRRDREIARLQREIAESPDPAPALERLGWMFVSKARVTFDDAFYTLAEQCALCLSEKRPGSPEAMLLRGHVLHNLHRFKEAEILARRLVALRRAPFDFGLLGDVLMEQGKLPEAVAAYQEMLDLKPDMHAYARTAHIRWLKGDLTGAIEAMQLAVSASSPRDAESAAWAHTRLAGYEFQAARIEAAHRLCEAALQLQTNYPPALLLQGRLLLAEGFDLESADVLQKAAQLNPLPEYQWALAEALMAVGRLPESEAIRSQIRKRGAEADPRTYALYLASQGEDVTTAVLLAEGELKSRGDVFTHDALAWSLAAAGRLAEARPHMERALAEGTQDARLFYHAAHIAAQSGSSDEARRRLDQALALKHLLLPRERERLQSLISAASRPSVSHPATHRFF